MKVLDCSFIIKDKKDSPDLFEEFEDKRPRKKINILITNNTANNISMSFNSLLKGNHFV